MIRSMKEVTKKYNVEMRKVTRKAAEERRDLRRRIQGKKL